ncbi:MAG: TraR/DksA family transcriptional regulator [Methylococcus sp.]
MADDEYMNLVQLAYFQERLRQMRTTCLRDLDSLWPELAATSGVADPADRASREEEQAVLLRLSHRESKLLNRIEAALLRIEAGTYGFCEDTGEPIGLPRLLARPMARLTIEAQQQRELRKNAYRS